MSIRPIRLITEGHADDPGVDIALSRALLLRGSAGEVPETFRINLPGRVVAFGKRDTITPGYPRAVAATRQAGFEAVERLAGGRAAAFHEGTLAFSWTIPDPDPRRRIHARFETLAALLVDAFSELGIESVVGEIPGEYCPGEYSVSVGGRFKVMGVGQRLARGAAHIGGVIVVSGGSLIRRVLEPVYRELELDWRPDTAGALQDVAPEVTLQRTIDAIAGQLAASHLVTPATFEPETLTLARHLASEHIAPTLTDSG